MNIHTFIKYIFLATCIALNLIQMAMADDDYIEARRLLNSGDILPLETILKNVRQIFPGKILDVELEKENQLIVYEIEVLGENGVIEKIYIDAKTGQQTLINQDN